MLVTHNRVKKLQQEVHAYLYELRCNINKNRILPKSCILLLLRVTQEASPLGYMKDSKGYVEDTKIAAQAENGYANKTRGYMTEAPTSSPSLYHLGMIQGSSCNTLKFHHLN
jgi:hypothetical protein